jgi:hypothetical protein
MLNPILSMPDSKSVAVYFVASPLQYLAARRIAENFEMEARQVLVWYKPGLQSIVKAEEWDACSYLPWPRLEPLPGLFGRHRRLRENIRTVANLIGTCDTLVIHSAVFDTEAINYFLHALPNICEAKSMHARILPDGLISIRRYPLNLNKRLLQHTRKIRRLFAPELQYQCFSGDRIGSDAPFCDRIYTLPNLPNEYPADKVAVLPPLVDQTRDRSEPSQLHGGRALVIGQPLVDCGLLSSRDAKEVSEAIRIWLKQAGIGSIEYKAHPKDPNRELNHSDYRLIDPSEALESYLASTHYDAVVGVRSSALLFARSIYPSSTRVLAFGWGKLQFKSKEEQTDMRNAFIGGGVEFM